MTTDRFYHLTCECNYEFMYDTAGEDYPECPACGCFLHTLKPRVTKPPFALKKYINCVKRGVNLVIVLVRIVKRKIFKLH